MGCTESSTIVRFTVIVTALSGAFGIGCAKTVESLNSCTSGTLDVITGSTGAAQVFSPDPMVASRTLDLSPSSLRLDDYRSRVDLANLGGRGVLEGKYVDVRNGVGCGEGFGAYDEGNQFLYSHADSRFQEAMAYFFGDRYRQKLDEAGYLQPTDPVKIIAHCMKDDNAYFVRQRDLTGRLVEKVCLGDSVETPGASYGDDAIVTVHELQHATTVDTYSVSQALNQFWYDEAGALNEAISDFMGLINFAPGLPAPFDPRIFSRWALGTFMQNLRALRGAHKCPMYDPSFPNCSGFPAFSASNNTISYVYPDGMGWPYGNNFDAPGYARSAFRGYPAQEEIHNAGMVLTGALWDAYDALASLRGDQLQAQGLMMKAVHETLKHLPKPTLSRVSPVTFRGFASGLVTYAGAVGFSDGDQQALIQALTARGLYGGPSLAADWASVGPGEDGSPGLKIRDNPSLLKSWLMRMGGDPRIITQGVESGINGQLDPGEVAVIWFDIRNMSEHTAGGIQLDITALDPEITFPDMKTNVGAISDSEAQIMYGKINGTGIVSSLTSANATYHVPTGNSYFQTNPFYNRTWNTALWIKVDPAAAHGKTVRFRVGATPSNGSASTADFQATIH